MLTNKYIDRICIFIMILAIAVTVVFMNGERLGIEPIIDPDAEAHSDKERFTENDLSVDWDSAQVGLITLSGESGTCPAAKSYFADGNVYITDGGYFEITGELTNGSIIIDAEKTSKVFLKLNDVLLHNEEDSCIRAEKADKVFLTLAEGSSNELSCGAAFCQEAQESKRKGAVFSRADLTINGSGSLAITNAYSHGIEANDDLVITGGAITIIAAGDGINVNDSFRYCDASLQITATDDGIHSDTEIDIMSGSIHITDSYEGIEAPYILIADGTIDIVFRDDGLNASVNPGDGVTGSLDRGIDRQPDTEDVPGRPFGNDTDRQPEAFEKGKMERPEGMTPPGGFGGQMPEMGQKPNGFGGVQGVQEAILDTDTDFGSEYGITPNANGCIIIAGGKITITNETGGDIDGIDSNGDIYILGGDVTITMAIQGMSEALDYGTESGGVLNVKEGCVTEVNTGSSQQEQNQDGVGFFGGFRGKR